VLWIIQLVELHKVFRGVSSILFGASRLDLTRLYVFSGHPVQPSTVNQSYQIWIHISTHYKGLIRPVAIYGHRSVYWPSSSALYSKLVLSILF